MCQNTSLLYPGSRPGPARSASDNATPSPDSAAPPPDSPDPGRRAFFSPLPRAVWDLRGQRRLTARDVDVLGLLLDYKGRATTEVAPRQSTLAARLGCSLDTIQRSLARIAAAGLIAKTRLRTAAGRLGRCVYDLAATLALMPRQAAKLRSGAWGRSPRTAARTPPESPQTRPQNCGLSQGDSESDAQADSGPAPPDPPPTPPATKPAVVRALEDVVRALESVGMGSRIAARLAAQAGAARCREALTALALRRNVADPPAWLYRCLTEGWDLHVPPASRPRAHLPWTPPSPPPARADADPLAALTPARQARLEATARAALAAELPLLRASLEAGRSRGLVTKRMRDLLLATRDGMAARDGGQPLGVGEPPSGPAGDRP